MYHTLIKHTYTTYRFPIGLEELIKKFSADDLQAFYRRHYFPANMWVCMCSCTYCCGRGHRPYKYIYLYIYIYIYIYIHICIYIHTYIHTYIYIYIHTYIHIRSRPTSHLRVWVYDFDASQTSIDDPCIHMYICIQMCVHVHIHTYQATTHLTSQGVAYIHIYK